MVLVLECGRAEIDQTYLRIEKHLALRSLSTDPGRGGWYPAVIRKCLRSTIAQQDILGLQVGVDQIKVVEDYTMLANIQGSRVKT